MPPKQGSSQKKAGRKTSSGNRAEIEIGEISGISGEVNIAAGNIVKTIQTIYERALTPSEIAEKDLETELNELAGGLRNYLERLKQQVTAPAPTTPYKGLEAYTLSDTEVFFGRDQAISNFLTAMERGRLTILQAESGAGKTSFLQAGIIPRLIAEEHLAMLIRPQFEHPTSAIKRCFIGNLELTPNLAHTPLVDFLRRVKEIIGNSTTLYLILDQFEEFFTNYTLDEDRQSFIHDIAQCLNDAPLNVRWIISITTDTFGQIGKFEPYIRNPFSNVQSLYLFSRQETAEVIAKTAKSYGLSFEAGLLDCLLDDLGQHQNAPIAPTQIQLVCLALYDGIQGKNTVFTLSQYEQQGGAEGILRGYIGNILNHRLPPEERTPAYKILEELITSEKKRILRVKSDLETVLASRGIPIELTDSTLDHLVNCRLIRRLGDQPESIQYEIVHDYLLKEIEITEDVRNAKEVEELLDQGVKNWAKKKLLLAPDVLRMIEASSTDHHISSDAAQLLFLSAIEYNRPAERWGNMISADDRRVLIDALLSERSSRKKRRALWSLRRYLTGPQRTLTTLTRSAFAILGSMPRVIVILIIGGVLLVIGAIGLNLTLYYIPWTKVSSINSQCLGGGTPSDPLVAIDAMDKSHVAVYDTRSHILCETHNTGSTWTHYENPLQAGLTINSIAIDSSIYLATNQGLSYQDAKSKWQNVKRPNAINSTFRDMAVDSDNKQIYVVDEQGLLYRYDLTTGKWKELPAEGITGAITDIAANYDYVAVSTQDGIWYRKIHSDEQWMQFNLKENVTIAAIEMVYPVRSWRPYFIGRAKDDWFLAATEKGEFYSGYLTESGGLEKMGVQLPAGASAGQISSLAVNGFSKFSGMTGGLYCEQSWLITDPEWWLSSRFSKMHPCQ